MTVVNDDGRTVWLLLLTTWTTHLTLLKKPIVSPYRPRQTVVVRLPDFWWALLLVGITNDSWWLLYQPLHSTWRELPTTYHHYLVTVFVVVNQLFCFIMTNRLVTCLPVAFLQAYPKATPHWHACCMCVCNTPQQLVAPYNTCLPLPHPLAHLLTLCALPLQPLQLPHLLYLCICNIVFDSNNITGPCIACYLGWIWDRWGLLALALLTQHFLYLIMPTLLVALPLFALCPAQHPGPHCAVSDSMLLIWIFWWAPTDMFPGDPDPL